MLNAVLSCILIVSGLRFKYRVHNVAHHWVFSKHFPHVQQSFRLRMTGERRYHLYYPTFTSAETIYQHGVKHSNNICKIEIIYDVVTYIS